MSTTLFEKRLEKIRQEHRTITEQPNERIEYNYNGISHRYKNPVLTADHIPVFWKYDLNPKTNPYLMQRFGINTVVNAGAMKWKGKYLLMARVEGYDRKSFFAVAESPNGTDNFRF